MKYKEVELFRGLRLIMEEHKNGKRNFIVHYNNHIIEGKKFKNGYVFKVPNDYPLYIPLFELRRVFGVKKI
jgi:hypothetical protein